MKIVNRKNNYPIKFGNRKSQKILFYNLLANFHKFLIHTQLKTKYDHILINVLIIPNLYYSNN